VVYLNFSINTKIDIHCRQHNHGRSASLCRCIVVYKPIKHVTEKTFGSPTSYVQKYHSLTVKIRVITKLLNSEQSSKGKVKTHKTVHEKINQFVYIFVDFCIRSILFLVFILHKTLFSDHWLWNFYWYSV